MEKIVIDTDILINYWRGEVAPLSELLKQGAEGSLELVASPIMLFEFYSGLELESPASRERADLLFSQFFIQDVTPPIAKLAAQLVRKNKLEGKVGKLYVLIAATAMILGAKLLTENRRHFTLIPGVHFVE